MTEPCQCENPGACPRWKIHTTHHLWDVCQKSPAHRKLWEENGGPFAGAGKSSAAIQKPPTLVPLKCLHLGQYTGRTKDCLSEN